MKENDNWFSKWEDELPSPDELTPLSQTLISPHLAIAFDISNNNTNTLQQNSPLLTNGDDTDVGTNGSDEGARTLKRPRLVWTPQLHKRFVDAVAQLGIKNAVPKTIMQLMSVDGLTRENVASHLQKYRLYLKRMQGLGNGNSGNGSGGDSATDHLFASSPVPAHFLHQGGSRGSSEYYLPYVPVAALQHQHQMAAASAAGHHGGGGQLQSLYHGQIGHFGLPRNGQFEHSFLSRQGNGHVQQQHLQQQGVHRVAMPMNGSVVSSYVDENEDANGRKVLTLFPTGDDDFGGDGEGKSK